MNLPKFSSRSLASPYVTPTAIVLFLLPVFLCVFIYATAFVFYLHQRHPGRIWRRLRKAVLEDHDILDAGRDIVATLWDVQGWIWFGYEVKGLENVPADGGALILYYHGALPIDYYYFVAKGRGIYVYLQLFLMLMLNNCTG